jgi:hypothetical protein
MEPANGQPSQRAPLAVAPNRLCEADISLPAEGAAASAWQAVTRSVAAGFGLAEAEAKIFLVAKP